MRAFARLKASGCDNKMVAQANTVERSKGDAGAGLFGALAPKNRAAVDVVTIDKPTADQLLELNHARNRPIRRHNLQRFCLALESGEFVVGSQIVLVYGEDGKPVLTDGQHRLKAISVTGIPAVMSVLRVSGNAHADYVMRDIAGVNRTGADAAYSEGIGEGLAPRERERYIGAVRVILANFSPSWGKDSRFMPRMKLVDRAREFFDSYKALRDLLGKEKDVTRATDFRSGLLAVALVTMEYAPAEINEEFWPNVFSPNMIASDDPRMKLYEWIMSNRILSGDTGIFRYAIAGATAWNYYVEGQKLRKMYVNKVMPKIKLTPYPTTTDEK